MFSQCIKNKNTMKPPISRGGGRGGGINFNEFPQIPPISPLPRITPPFNSDVPTTSFGYDCPLIPSMPPKQHSSTPGNPPILPPKQHSSTPGNPPILPPKQHSSTPGNPPPFPTGPIDLNPAKTKPSIDETDNLLVVTSGVFLMNETYDNLRCDNIYKEDIFPSPITTNDGDYVEMDQRKERSSSNASNNKGVTNHNPRARSQSELPQKTPPRKPFPPISTQNLDEDNNFKLLLYYFNLCKEQKNLLETGNIPSVRLDKDRYHRTKIKYKNQLEYHSQKYNIPINALVYMLKNQK